jgi:hypothetical protein
MFRPFFLMGVAFLLGVMTMVAHAHGSDELDRDLNIRMDCAFPDPDADAGRPVSGNQMRVIRSMTGCAAVDDVQVSHEGRLESFRASYTRDKSGVWIYAMPQDPRVPQDASYWLQLPSDALTTSDKKRELAAQLYFPDGGIIAGNCQARVWKGENRLPLHCR